MSYWLIIVLLHGVYDYDFVDEQKGNMCVYVYTSAINSTSSKLVHSVLLPFYHRSWLDYEEYVCETTIWKISQK